MFVGLTGAPACGKSTVLEIFKDMGWSTLDADIVCHKIYEDKPEWLSKSFSERWGAAAFNDDGAYDRKAIAKRVFADKEELEWLDSLIHPEVRRRAMEWMKAHGKTPCIFEVPLLFEAGWADMFDAVIGVWTSPSTQMSRIVSRGWSEEDAKKRIDAQIASGKKLEMADFGIIDDCEKDCLLMQCEELDRQIKLNYT